ncbi:hypothetical protein CPB86DRAFT_334111 [Serendipita vermifera]|nr:hypothetical protein CPB86DRAFT_334111 [Serendipita vermifera]
MNRRMDPLPEGWTMYIHPEGKPYYHRDAREPESNLLRGTPLYYNEKPLCRPLPIVTDSDPRNPITRKTLEHAHFITRVTVADNDLELPEHTELFLELYPDVEPGLHPYAGYYLADHDNQVVFWADQISTSDLDTHPVNPGTFADQHPKLQLGYQYWRHVECYPIDANIDIKQVEHALIEQLSFMSLDMATSDTSTAPWTEAQCQTYISVLHHTPASRKTWTVSRLMALTAYWQFRNFYGHPSARLDRTHSYEVEVKAIEPVAPAEQKQASKKMSSIK